VVIPVARSATAMSTPVPEPIPMDSLTVLGNMRCLTLYAEEMFERAGMQAWRLKWSCSRVKPLVITYGLQRTVELSRYYLLFLCLEDLKGLVVNAIYLASSVVTTMPMSVHHISNITESCRIPKRVSHKCLCGFMNKTSHTIDRHLQNTACAVCSSVINVNVLSLAPPRASFSHLQPL